MTTGLVAPTANYTEADLVREQQGSITQDQKRRAAIEAGAAALGVVQSPLRDAGGTIIAYTYEPRRTPQAGLPARLVGDARVAVERASASVRALVKRDAESVAWCARHGVAGEAAMTKITLERAELSTAALEADRDAAKALHALGEAHIAISQARAAKAALEGRTDAEARRHAQVLATIERDGQDADRVLSYWGVV